MKKILFATDFSKNAEKAFHFALKIAEKHKADLVMLHVFASPPVWGHPYIADPAEMARQAVISYESKLQELFEQFNSKLIPTFVAVENSSVVKGILSVVKKHQPDLLITGVKGKNLLKEIFIGSTTKALLKKSPVPLLAIPENAYYRTFKKVIYTSDLQNTDLTSLEQLIEFVKPYKPEIKVVHICTDGYYSDHEKMEWFEDLVKENITYKHISFDLLLADNIFARLNTYVKENDFDLMVMLEREHTGIFERLFHEDLVWKMEFNTSIPLLSYNASNLHAAAEKDITKSDSIEH
jgi:nucleotide-binding universal stress UspA family protein